MKKAAIIFILAVFMPALLLGYLSLQSARQQGVLIESQEARLRQQQVDALAAQVELAVRVEHERFMDAVGKMQSQHSLSVIARDFNLLLNQYWSRKSIGFSVVEMGGILSPRARSQSLSTQSSVNDTDLTEQFIVDNAAFIQGKVEADAYATTNDSLQSVQAEMLMKQKSSRIPLQRQSKDIVVDKKLHAAKLKESKSRGQVHQAQAKRNVMPQSYANEKNRLEQVPNSNLNIARSTFKELIAGQQSGIVTRFIDDRLEMLFWMRPQPSQGQNRQAVQPEYVLGARVLPEDLNEVITSVVRKSGMDGADVLAAVLDDRTRPFVTFPADSQTATSDWSRPFVASEIGEVLPHWEVVLYLRNPSRLTRAATVSSWTISGLILISLAAIVAGGTLLMVDTRRQLELARKKTDFVSNVSHELKTPLTSIRMFAELLREKRVEDAEKQDRYLSIITVEAERLTRLINNVLDFSRMERNKKTYHKEPLDLYPLIETIWSGQELHLQQEGFQVHWHAEDGPYPVYGDADALAQILVNLISNAEKYSDTRKEIELHSYLDSEEVRIAVMDRGMGIPVGDESKIFEHFYRAHDSLATGIQGSGLGLTLAARIAADHGGRITFQRREGTGSRFTLHLPRETTT